MKKEKSKSVGPLNGFVPYQSVQTERKARNQESDMMQEKYNSMHLFENGYVDLPISEPQSSS